jgi:hypothetical protein
MPRFRVSVPCPTPDCSAWILAPTPKRALSCPFCGLYVPPSLIRFPKRRRGRRAGK